MKAPPKAAKQAAAAAGVAFLLYYIGGSMFWGEPETRIELPASADPNADLPLKVCVRAMHANFEIAQVRFDWDRWERFSAGENSAVPIHIAHEGKRREYWTNWELKRFTWPRERCVDVAIPLAKFRAEGMLPGKRMTGRVIVEVEYARGPRRGRRMGRGRIASWIKRDAIPVEVMLTGSEAGASNSPKPE